jgi:hypothetical protein
MGAESAAEEAALIRQAAKDIKDWEEANKKALGSLCSTLSKGIRHEVIHIEKAQEAYEYLKGKYDVRSYIQSVEGIRSMMSTHYGECSGVQDYLQRMAAAVEKVKIGLKVGESFPESLAIQFLFANLGESWDVFLTSYINSSKYDPAVATVGSISQILIQEEMRVKMSSASVSLIKAQKGKKKSGKKPGGDKKSSKSSLDITVSPLVVVF